MRGRVTVLVTLATLCTALTLMVMSRMTTSHSPQERALPTLPPGGGGGALRAVPPGGEVAPPSGGAAEGALGGTIRQLEEKLSELTRYLRSGGGKKDPADRLQLSAVSPAKEYPRVCCFIITDPAVLGRTAFVRDTWARRCDKALFMSAVQNDSFPTVGLGMDTISKSHLAAKSRKSWIYMYENHINDCEFFLKGDPDTYMIMENLKDFLVPYNPEDSQYFGHRYHTKTTPFTYMAGGPGVILSRAAVKALVEKAFRSPNATVRECMYDGGGEDWRVGECLYLVGSKPVETRDSLGRQRFIVLHLEEVMNGRFPQWYIDRDEEGATMGANCCSDYPIGFHYISRENMWAMEYLWYRTKKKFDLGIQQKVPAGPEHATKGY